ncbi:hypothetical protein [Spirilliplanes yamanashiensis]|uniref:Prenyltransferase n=1 Tax=Spirilliplanes yamanashiensis TaxID=42233 RepID=A0A8J3Y8K0_9ACTN|nr:hypothetical protein [Spirilliplanes yamanashiensis]MDP9817129.1 hypothetical protein [Spirilliplanes yamanashiensis]GIJ03218.1 hypothetical protein Sya03_25700 [Spirilliplanes yamanashiensis]
MTDPFAAAHRFLLTEGRLLERRLFDTVFLGAPPTGVADALRGYANPDGGLGHGLEPDTCGPASLPIAVEQGLNAYADAGADDPELLRRACDFLAGVSTPDGAVALAAPVIERYPRAAHMTDWTYVPGVNPTAGLAGLLHRVGFAHPWRDAATAYCWAQLESGAYPGEAHALSELFVFLAHVPDRERAESHVAAVAGRLATAEMFQADAGAEGYGLTPLAIAPAADSPWRRLFTEEQLAGHLDALAAAQQDDGGWPITWDPPGTASRLAWRGIVTLGALRTLVSYGRLAPPQGFGGA